MNAPMRDYESFERQRVARMRQEANDRKVTRTGRTREPMHISEILKSVNLCKEANAARVQMNLDVQ